MSTMFDRIQREVSDQAKAVYEQALVWDNVVPWGGAEWGDVDTTMPVFERAGINVMSLTIAGIGLDFEDTLRWLAKTNYAIEQNADRMVVCKSIEDIDKAHADGKVAVLYNLQETRQFGHSIELVKFFYDLGIKQALLSYNIKNAAGDGCAERTDAGVSRWGIEVIREMNRVGMLVDGTHCGYRTSMEAIEISESPFVFSHSNAYARYPHYRNIRDDQIKACAATGGVIGLNGLGEFYDDHEATSMSIFTHIDHIANLVGPEHIGFGLDYVGDEAMFWEWVEQNPFMWPVNEGQTRTGSKFSQPEQLLEITDIMLKRGYSETDVTNILGGNWKRVCKAVWK